MGKRKERSSNVEVSQSMTTRSMESHDRKLRYRTLLEGFSSLDDEGATMKDKIEYTSQAITETNNLLSAGSKEELVKHPGESYLASRVLRAAGDMAARCAQNVSGNVNIYDRRELAMHIKENPTFWVVQFPHEAPPAAYLHGAFEPTPPAERPRASRRRAERQAAAEKKAPANIDKMEKTEEGNEMVRRVNHFINKECQRGPLSYFHMVLDPDSFSRSVENIYHLSFLAREGVVAVFIDEEHGLPFVSPMGKSAPGAGAGESQFIVSLDMQRWQELVKAFKIKTPMHHKWRKLQ